MRFRLSTSAALTLHCQPEVRQVNRLHVPGHGNDTFSRLYVEIDHQPALFDEATTRLPSRQAAPREECTNMDYDSDILSRFIQARGVEPVIKYRKLISLDWAKNIACMTEGVSPENGLRGRGRVPSSKSAIQLRARSWYEQIGSWPPAVLS